MPRGMEAVRDAVAEIEARKNSGGDGSFRNWFRLDDRQSAVVRFLEQGDEVKWAWCHEVPIEGKSWGRQVPCRDQDENGQRIGESCPGCEAPDGDKMKKRKFQGFINLIWRNAPVFKRGSDGKLVKENGKLVVESTADQVAVWQAGVMVFEELDGKDVTYKGLTSRDFRISRRGAGMDTKYFIEPADPDGGAQPLSKHDQELAAEKYDLTLDVTPQTYDQWGKRESATDSKPEVAPSETSPFTKKS